jgi:hypothetical protein
MVDEKDKLGEKLHQKEKAEEDRYFAERDRAAIEKLRRAETAAARPPGMRCPKCGAALAPVKHHGLMVEECPTCHGVWLDAGELEQIAQRERDSWLGRLFYRPRR